MMPRSARLAVFPHSEVCVRPGAMMMPTMRPGAPADAYLHVVDSRLAVFPSVSALGDVCVAEGRQEVWLYSGFAGGQVPLLGSRVTVWLSVICLWKCVLPARLSGVSLLLPAR